MTLEQVHDENSADWRTWYRYTSLERLEEGALLVAQTPDFNRKTYMQWRLPRFGKTNPEQVFSSVWEWQYRCGLDAYAANEFFKGPSSFGYKPAWSAPRLGQIPIDLPDGRLLLIAGEYEDSYDPDFYIYNDVAILHADGKVEIFLYTREHFPPTDFYSATLIGDKVWLIGNLGYPEDRTKHAQIFIFDIETMKFERVIAEGDNPGWIHSHAAKLSDDGKCLIIDGGGIFTESDGINENIDTWAFQLHERTWQNLTKYKWRRWSFYREDAKAHHLMWYSTLEMAQMLNLGNNHAQLAEWIGAEPDLEAYKQLFSPPVPHQKIDSADSEAEGRRIVIHGVTFRYSIQCRNLVITAEEEVHSTVMDAIIQHTQSMMRRMENCAINVKELQ